jgi:hypothetical protein
MIAETPASGLFMIVNSSGAGQIALKLAMIMVLRGG